MADDNQSSQPEMSPEMAPALATETPSVENHSAENESIDLRTPTVDELEDRLADLQGAMDKLQSGDLDGAEASIAALEEQLAAARGAGS